MGTVKNFRSVRRFWTGRYLTHLEMDESILTRHTEALDAKREEVQCVIDAVNVFRGDFI